MSKELVQEISLKNKKMDGNTLHGDTNSKFNTYYKMEKQNCIKIFLTLVSRKE